MVNNPNRLNLLPGTIYGNFTILNELVERDKYGGTQYNVRCICGREMMLLGTRVKCKKLKSCGCLTIIRPVIKHNLYGSSEYSSWQHMKARCCNINSHVYHHYGGRGIKICDRWVNSFQNFIDDMGFKPTPKHTIDRVDNNGDYEPGNCKWVTISEQQRNRRNNVHFIYNGEKVILKDLPAILNVSYGKIRYRLIVLKDINKVIEYFKTYKDV